MDDLDLSTGECHFLIPLTKEDLLKHSPGNYWVEKLLDRNACIDKLKGVKKSISDKGCSCIEDHFDILFSILYDKEISFTQLEGVYDGVIIRLVNDLPRYIREVLKVDNHRLKLKACNIIKMNLYIFSLFEKSYEDKLSFKSEHFISEPKRMKGRTKPKSLKTEETWDWNMKKKSAFVVICEILQEKLCEIWPSHIVEESLINLIGNCCYKAFENADVGQAKLKSLRDTVSQVMAVLVASYNHGLTFITKAVELMKDNEHVASSISNTAIIMAKEYNCSTVIPKLLNELNSAIQDQDIPGLAKCFATFITDIAEADPSLLLGSVKALSVNLIVEPYVVRNATLLAFCEIILKFYSIENLDDEGKEVRDTLLRFLHNHLRDQNSYVRSKVLQLWSKLASACVIPRSFYLPVLQTAKNRISDKSSIASKNAIQLFTVVLQKNIYAAKLNLNETRSQLMQQKIILKNIGAKRKLSREEAWPQIEVNLILELNKYFSDPENEKDDEEMDPTQSIDINHVLIVIIKLLHSGHFHEAIKLLKQSELQFPNAQEIRCNMDKNSDKIEYYTAVFRKIFTKVPDVYELMMSVEVGNSSGEDPEEYSKQKARVDYLEESLQFTLLMIEVSKDVNAILNSKSVMGVSEAIEFFTVAYQFGIPDAKTVLRNILMLVRCDQPTIKDAVAAAFKKLYLETCHSTQKAKALQIARRLIKFLKDLNMEQKGALEDLINLWIQNDELDKEFIYVLWEKFSKKNDSVTDEESISALILLDMIAFKKPTLVTSNLEIIIESGFNKHDNLMAAEYSCKILSKLKMIKRDGKTMRLPNNHLLFETIENVLVSNFDKTNIPGYKPMSLAAISMISQICNFPEKVLDIILKKLYQKLVDQNENLPVSDVADIFVAETMSVKEILLERLILIHGEILFRKWNYLNNDVINTLSKNNKITQEQNNVNDEEMDEFEAEYKDAEEDELMNTITGLCEELILEDSTFDAYIRDLTIKVCNNSRKKPYSSTLKSAAAISLAKYMMISQSFCEDKIQLFVTLMETSKDEVVRSNLVLAIGDLLMRFPNVIEPWTSHLFTRLSDPCTLVRKNTVLVICHLVSREMIKVRRVADVCLCLDDPEPSIAEKVHSLFVDLSRKGNTIYNIIPDIISRLSNPERSENITSELFDKIMKFILGLIGKERQNELLVEKLCVRLSDSVNMRQWRDLAFCLQQLNYSEKALKKLIDALPTLNERLLCPDVHKAIIYIFNNAQKSSKQNLKETASEGLAKVEELLTSKDKGDNVSKRQVIEKAGKVEFTFSGNYTCMKLCGNSGTFY